MPRNHKRKLPVEIISDAEVRRLMDACSKRGPTGTRNRALIAFLYRTGLRISEALDLLPRDINCNRQIVLVRSGKGNKSRQVGIDSGALAVVQQWTVERDKLGIGPDATLFCTLAGGRLKNAYIRELLPRLARKAQIGRRVHAHAFRHTFASQLLEEGVDIGRISILLGHTSLLTTEVYLDHISPQRALDAVRERTWTV